MDLATFTSIMCKVARSLDANELSKLLDINKVIVKCASEAFVDLMAATNNSPGMFVVNVVVVVDILEVSSFICDFVVSESAHSGDMLSSDSMMHGGDDERAMFITSLGLDRAATNAVVATHLSPGGNQVSALPIGSLADAISVESNTFFENLNGF